MRSSKSAPQVNAGSMADIAFLLLIFFLVTTTIASDQGIQRKLPKLCPEGQDCTVDIHERNILRININGKQEIMLQDEVIPISMIKEKVIAFVDNNGDGSCNYCNGHQFSNSSDNPQKAVVSLQAHREASYEIFIKVQDELTKAYSELRNAYLKNVLKTNKESLTEQQLEQLKKAYPFIISEALTK